MRILSLSNRPFALALSVSLLWHIASFSSIDLTFSNRPKLTPAGQTNFLGELLGISDLMIQPKTLSRTKTSPIGIDLKTTKFLKNQDSPVLQLSGLKPQVSYFLSNEKPVFKQNTPPFQFNLNQESAVMFYPRLPRYFLLYFNNRQKIHMEIAFFIASDGSVKLVKRRISCGNLDADLLAQRYMTRWLYLQKYNFSPNSWQSVKIDLGVEKK